ncbi:MAG: ABC transporter permease [Oscillospiraceae bacterium]|nr:ABC transporter permease [Oscillospiraceae bacterium]
MNKSIVLIKRNMKLFLRDRATVFFSFLSTIILVALYFLFIGEVFKSEMQNSTTGAGSFSITSGAQNFIVYLQMMAGVLVLNSMSLATGAFSTIAKDFENKRVDSFILTPVKTREMIFSYFATGIIAGFGLNLFTWMVSFTVIGVATGYWLAVSTFLTVVLVLFTASLISCSLTLLIVTLVKSSSAIGVINGVAGTFFGFLCGIYMPYGNLGDGVKAVGSILPLSHLTIWLKRVVLDDAFSQLGIEGEYKETLYRDFFSAESIGFLNFSAPLWLMIVFSGLLGLTFWVLSYGILRKRFKR